MPKADLFALARRAAAWAALAKWLDMIGSTVTFLVMVRLLGPESFGLYGMALLAILLPETIVGGALGESLIQKRELRPGHVSGTFVLHLGLALVLTAALLGLTPLLSVLFGEAELKLLIPTMSATLIVMALGAAPAALLQRDLKFGAIACVDAIGTVTAAVVGVGLGLAGFGVWALIWMEVARRSVRSIAFIVAARWRPSFAVRREDLADLMRFNLMTLATRLLTQTDQAIPRLIVSATMGAQALGYFNLAWRIFQQGSAVIIAPFNAVALPVASGVQHDRSQLHAALSGATRVAALVAYPAFFGAAAIAPAAIPLLLGASWAPAIPAIQLSLLLGVRAATASFNGGVLRGCGRPDLQLASVISGVLILLVLVPLAAPFGLTAVFAAILLRSLATWGLGAWLVQRTAGYPARLQFLIGWESLAAAAVMAGVVLGGHALLAGVLSGWLLLPVLLALGVASHVAALSVLAPVLARRLGDIVLAVLRRDRKRLSVLLRDGFANTPAGTTRLNGGVQGQPV